MGVAWLIFAAITLWAPVFFGPTPEKVCPCEYQTDDLPEPMSPEIIELLQPE